MSDWTIQDSDELYNVSGWSQGYFRINDQGHLAMCPPEAGVGEIDLKALIDDLQRRGLELPILVRFTDLIGARISTLQAAFQAASEDYGYRGRYRCVYPIKVNQQRFVLRDLVRNASETGLGLEAGSKPELMVILTLLDPADGGVIICNGYKDRQYIEMALLARKIGHQCIVVIEKPDELDLILETADRLGIEPLIGVRSKLAAKGVGHWQSSAGDGAKFGLTVDEIVDIVDRLTEIGRIDALQLLHFHIGSQISAIRAFRDAVREAARLFTELHAMGAPMRFLDVGGGLGVDYDGSRSNFSSSMNYDDQEYANSVISAINEACERAQVPHPDIITEAGRALVAYSSALIFDVLGTTSRRGQVVPPRPEGGERLIQDMYDVYEAIASDNLLEPLHDIQEMREECITRFNLGLLDLRHRALGERLYWAASERLVRCADRVAQAEEDDVPEELENVREKLSDTYYCNFSLFQSVPDSWAISQLFPVIPLHRHKERPTRRGVIADLTCDSDGKIDKFINWGESKPFLELHNVRRGRPYYLGVFLVGAYQEILGDLHNLFGDTNTVHVAASPGEAGYRVLHVAEGDTIEDVLSYVQYDKKQLLRRIRDRVESAVEAGRMAVEEAGALVKAFNQGLDSYTYLDRREQ